VSRTIGEIGAKYDAERQAILERISQRAVSASMSGIEYYPKPWGELDITDDGDLMFISVTLAWDDEAQAKSHTNIRKLTPDELKRDRQLSALFREPPSPAREEKIAALKREKAVD